MTRMAHPTCAWGFSGRLPALVAASLFGLGFSASPAAAQPASPANGESPSQHCRVYTVERIEGPAQELRADCRGRGVILGPATAFTVIANERLNASLVDMQFQTERRVWLLSMGADGLPLLEDISGQIALAAGRGPMSEIGDIVVNAGEFASTGRIAVRPDDRVEVNRGQVRQLALDEQLERERTRPR